MSMFLSHHEASSSLNSPDNDYPLLDIMRNVHVRHGRTFHAYHAGSYKFPNDHKEQKRLEWQFDVIRKANAGMLYFAPVPYFAKEILDVGTGKGDWCIAVAENKFSLTSRITGIDLSPIQHLDVPENVYFEVEDCTDSEWARPQNSTDFVHVQLLMGALQYYEDLIIKSRSYLTRGSGWLECCELDFFPYTDDDTIPATYSYLNWVRCISEASEGSQVRRPLRVGPKLKQWFINAGYIDVEEVVSKVPIGGWATDPDLKALGIDFKKLLIATMSPISIIMFEEAYGWTSPMTEGMCAQASVDLQNKTIHAYVKLYTVYGRRPSSWEEGNMNWRSYEPAPIPAHSHIQWQQHTYAPTTSQSALPKSGNTCLQNLSGVD